jgi:bifunctional DNA-binding transcriptional regulator/antitoxin component of YhaV-PrlF toxin-antitoxin module
MSKMMKILGKRGRITIPYEIRERQGFQYNDVVSFEEKDNVVIVKREKICDSCSKSSGEPLSKPTDEITLLDFLDGLTDSEQRAALIHLSVKWAIKQEGSNKSQL